MGGYNEVTLDRDWAFDVNSLNELLARSFLNGFCGGFANGCITAVGVFAGRPLLGNAIGGFIGNEIIENFNNMDIADPQE